MMLLATVVKVAISPGASVCERQHDTLRCSPRGKLAIVSGGVVDAI